MENKIYPVITLYQPWATWIMRGWKTIETRTHNRFASLAHKKILIHAGLTNDPNAVNAFYHGYLSKEKLLLNPDEMINGFILGSAYVTHAGRLFPEHSFKALIECDTLRFGLFLQDIERWEIPIPEKGEMGIWYYDMEAMMKVKKASIKNYSLL